MLGIIGNYVLKIWISTDWDKYGERGKELSELSLKRIWIKCGSSRNTSGRVIFCSFFSFQLSWQPRNG